MARPLLVILADNAHHRRCRRPFPEHVKTLSQRDSVAGDPDDERDLL